MAVSISALVVLMSTTTTHAFGIVRQATRISCSSPTRLEAFSFPSVGGFLLSDEIGDAMESTADALSTATDSAMAAAAAASVSEPEAFTDQIDFFGDPTVQNLFFAFGGFVLVLAGLSIVSQKVDDAIENVIVDFESVLKTNPEFRSEWQGIQAQLEEFDASADGELQRKQKLFEIMEELQAKDPALMAKINAKMNK